MNLNDIMSASTLKGIGKKANATPEEVKSVLSTALPVLVQSMANNAKEGEGAESLDKALSQHAASKASVKNVDAADGVKILKHVLGGDVKAVNSSIAKKSGVKASTAAGILALAAPLLMNALGQEKEDSNTSSSGLTKLLLSLLKGGAGSSAGLLGALLDASGSSDKEDKNDDNDLLGSLLGAFSGDDDDDDDSVLAQVGSLAASLGGSGKKDDNGLAGLLLNMLKSK